MKLSAYEVEVLAMLDGSGPELPWGAAMGSALEFLREDGLCTRGPHYQITGAGKMTLERLRKGEPS